MNQGECDKPTIFLGANSTLTIQHLVIQVNVVNGDVAETARMLSDLLGKADVHRTEIR